MVGRPSICTVDTYHTENRPLGTLNGGERKGGEWRGMIGKI